MTKLSISETTIAKQSNVRDYAKDVRKFLIENVAYITLNHDIETGLLNLQDTLVKSVISELYQQAIREDKLGIFTLLNLNKVDKIPSWFLISWLDIDTLELRDIDKSSYDVLSSIPQYKDKILVDITSYISKRTGKISDIPNFHARLVRDMLSRSYHLANRMWLSPTILYSLTKFYSMIISNKIGRTYNLTYQEQHVVATILAVYFTNRCTDIDEVINPVMYKMDFLQKVVDTKSIFKAIKDKRSKAAEFDLQSVVDTIIDLGPSRMNKFTLSTFYSMNANLSSNQLMSLIALDYPPYWCYLILDALSGAKSSIYHTIKSLNMRKEVNRLQVEIIKTKTFINSL